MQFQDAAGAVEARRGERAVGHRPAVLGFAAVLAAVVLLVWRRLLGRPAARRTA